MRAVVRNHGLSALPISDKIAMHIRAFMRFPQSAWIIPRLFHFFLTCLACSEKNQYSNRKKAKTRCEFSWYSRQAGPILMPKPPRIGFAPLDMCGSISWYLSFSVALCCQHKSFKWSIWGVFFSFKFSLQK